jgi:serine/threonine-protein kinase
MASSMLGEWADMGEIESPPDELVITRVADYDVLRVIGRGGMGVVCRARDRLLGRDVALKLMHSGVLASDEELRRFRTEAEAVARLRHPNLVSIYEAGDADGQAYYTMSLAEGGTLGQRLADQGMMDSPAAAKLVECLALAIHHAHTRGVLHRDIKPANIVFDANGTPMVSDFGLARFTTEASVTDSGSLVGTPAYLAPEVASGVAGHTTSSDVYALGVLLYECIAGRAPFENDSPLALLKIISEQEPPALSSFVKDIDSDLEAVCMKALEKDPARRYASAEAFAQDLRHWLDDEPVSARSPLLSERFWRWAHRHQSRAILYTMTAVSLVILVVASAVMNVLLSQEHSRLADAIRHSDTRRAALLRDFASRLLQSPNSSSEAREFLIEAANAGTGNPGEDHAINLRLRVIDRLSSINPEPLPRWTGTGLVEAGFDKSGHLFLKTKTGSHELTSSGETKPIEGEFPLVMDSEKGPVAEIEGSTVRAWSDAAHTRKLGELILPDEHPLTAQVSPDERYVAVIAQNSRLTIWELSTRLPVSPGIPINTPAAHLLWWGGTKHQVVLWNDHEATWFDW